MKILGVDPGTARVGWAVVQVAAQRVTPVAYGCVTTNAGTSVQARLLDVYTQIREIITTHTPDALSVEELFFSTNAKTAIPVGQARGVILLAAASEDIPVVSYTPPAVKRAVCGHGQATKDQVQRMVTRLLKLAEVPKPDDVADALAIALTHAYSYKMKQAV